MTTEQATEIRTHLINELNANGFNDIVNEVNTRLQHDYGEGEFENTPRALLNFFLTESIDILEGISNNNFDSLINRFNFLNQGNIRVDKIIVDHLNQGESESFDLSQLPNYRNIVLDFQEILIEISNEN